MGFLWQEGGAPDNFWVRVTWHNTQDGLKEGENWRRETTRVCSSNLGRDDGLGGCGGRGEENTIRGISKADSMGPETS